MSRSVWRKRARKGVFVVLWGGGGWVEGRGMGGGMRGGGWKFLFTQKKKYELRAFGLGGFLFCLVGARRRDERRGVENLGYFDQELPA